MNSEKGGAGGEAGGETSEVAAAVLDDSQQISIAEEGVAVGASGLVAGDNANVDNAMIEIDSCVGPIEKFGLAAKETTEEAEADGTISEIRDKEAAEATAIDPLRECFETVEDIDDQVATRTYVGDDHGGEGQSGEAIGGGPPPISSIFSPPSSSPHRHATDFSDARRSSSDGRDVIQSNENGRQPATAPPAVQSARRLRRSRPGAYPVGPRNRRRRQPQNNQGDDPSTISSPDPEAEIATLSESHTVDDATLVHEPPVYVAERIVERSQVDNMGDGLELDQEGVGEHDTTECLRSRSAFLQSFDKKQVRCMAVVLAAVVIAVTGVALGVTLSSRGSSSLARVSVAREEDKPNVPPTTVETASTVAPISGPMPASAIDPTASPMLATPASPRFTAISEFIVSDVSGSVALDPESPQGGALLWIANEDPLALDIHKDGKRMVQRYVLMVLYYALGGENWVDSAGYGTGEDECDTKIDGISDGWFGVNCDSSGMVTRLTLSNNNLVGPYIPSEISRLSRLQYLSLYQNWVGGSIPESLSALSDLESLSLWRNLLEGTIPSMLRNMPKLRFLNLGPNMLTGSIPSQLGSIISLELLDIHGNRLNTTLPVSLTSLSNLRVLEISQGQNANLHGTIPSSIGELQNLEILTMAGGYLTGAIPDGITRLRKLVHIDLSSNMLTNTIPASFGDLHNLKTCSMHNNQLNGTIPEGTGQLQRLDKLYLHRNNLVGSMPSSICDLGLEKLSSDCGNASLVTGGPQRELECSCCTDCCEDGDSKQAQFRSGSVC